MSYIFVGLCAIYIGSLFFKKEKSLLTEHTKKILKNLGWWDTPIFYEEDPRIKIIDENIKNKIEKNKKSHEIKEKLQSIIDKKIEHSRIKKEHNELYKKVCDEILEKNKGTITKIYEYFFVQATDGDEDLYESEVESLLN